MKEITFRIANPQDAKELLDIYAYYVEHTAITFEYEVPSIKEFQQRIENTLKKYPYILVLEDNQIIGYGYAGAFYGRAAYDWSCEMTIYLDPKVQKKGIGKQLYQNLERILKEMGICNLYACIAYPQVEDEYLTKNSVQFHEHLGYRLVGTFQQCGYKFHRWYDMVWMEKIIGDHQTNQADIIPFKELLHQNQNK